MLTPNLIPRFKCSREASHGLVQCQPFEDGWHWHNQTKFPKDEDLHPYRLLTSNNLTPTSARNPNRRYSGLSVDHGMGVIGSYGPKKAGFQEARFTTAGLPVYRGTARGFEERQLHMMDLDRNMPSRRSSTITWRGVSSFTEPRPCNGSIGKSRFRAMRQNRLARIRCAPLNMVDAHSHAGVCRLRWPATACQIP